MTNSHIRPAQQGIADKLAQSGVGIWEKTQVWLVGFNIPETDGKIMLLSSGFMWRAVWTSASKPWEDLYGGTTTLWR